MVGEVFDMTGKDLEPATRIERATSIGSTLKPVSPIPTKGGQPLV